MTDKEIALELTKIVIGAAGLKTHTDTEYNPEYGEARYKDVAKTDIAKEAASIYNVIFDEISKKA